MSSYLRILHDIEIFNMLEKNTNNRGNDILAYVLVFLGVLLLGFMARSVAFMFFMLVVVGLFICSVFYLISQYQKSNQKKTFSSSVEGTIHQNIQLCEQQIIRNEKESIEIEQNISEIKEKLNAPVSIHEATKKDSEQLIKAFERELELREAKLEFYNSCKEKLENIQYNKDLADELNRKKDKLQQLQEDHYEDLAEMERLRSDMEYDRTFVDTINELSLRMKESTNLDSAKALHKELRLITNELRDL